MKAFQLQKVPKWILILAIILIVTVVCGYTTEPFCPLNSHFLFPPNGTEIAENNQDLTLTNLYRRLHNLDSIMRNEVFKHLDHPGGGEGNKKEFLIGEQFDREMSKIKYQIRKIIEARRNAHKYSQPYWNDVPTQPLGGNFYQCHLGDCQWDLDNNNEILGIPSVPGIRHTYN